MPGQPLAIQATFSSFSDSSTRLRTSAPKASEETARNTKKLVQAATTGGLTFA